MKNGRRIISGQLRVGDTDLPTYRLADITAKIDAAHKLAGLRRVLFLPSHNTAVNKSIIRHCRRKNIEVYLWYKVLADNDIMPERNELVEDAFGGSGSGESGVWERIFQSEENYLFACPVNEKYNALLLNRCKQALDEYDGLFVDNIGYPLPSLGIEGIFTCFCPACMEREPRLKEWRRNVHELREAMMSATDADFEKWGTFLGQAKAFDLTAFYSYRMRLITTLAQRYARAAAEMGKAVGLDVLSPALSYFAGHDFAALGELAAWLKPRIYCHTFGPSSIPLEYYCLGIGGKAWARRADMPAIMQFIARSIELELPHNLHNLTQAYLSHEAASSQINRAVRMTGAPIHPGIECSLHPDYETELNENTVRAYLEASRDCPGVVLAWNLLFVPEVFLRLVGEILHV